MKRQARRMLFLIFGLSLLLLSCTAPPAGMRPTAEETETATSAETKEREETNMTTPAKPKDDVIDVLMIGNSWCYYYVEELFGMAKAAGIKMRVCNVYYSGCTLAKHYNWYTNGEKNYSYYETYENGRVETKKVGLVWCLEQHDWDVVTLQNGSGEQRAGDVNYVLNASKIYRARLYGIIRDKAPDAKLYWHQTWAFEVGHTKSDGFIMKDKAQQVDYTEQSRQVATGICAENKVARVNTGDAWEIYRENCDKAGIVHNLCARLGWGELDDRFGYTGDGSHDGDTGGGQFLNACVWFEVLTGKDCRENSYAPTYTRDGKTYRLSDEQLRMLKEAAHEAVSVRLPQYPEWTGSK